MMKKTILSLLITLCPILTFASDYIYLESSDSDNTTDEYSDSIVPNPIDEDISNLNSNQINKKTSLNEKKDRDENIYDVVEQMPSFQGGAVALMSYINKTLKFPAEDCGQGRVIVSFVVEKDGSITNAIVTRSVDPAFDREALKIINSMPKWIPGKKNGRNVRVRFNVPVQFKLQ
ncbi:MULTISPECIES: energy transducer TonB [Prevotella]|uniref:TonB C-terminal domain-containing protein n=1 Tax=Prevotella herbatica TaxID=2801997 RepID=A0ABN6EDX1_9BACT|nr:energy transducer TonB [Prevotella herbatica]BCS84152.1 hypothetical protein prwr041_00450 [Prevotella herbatica]